MLFNHIRAAALLLTFATLTSCSEPAPEAPSPEAATTQAASGYNTTVTIREIMSALIDPSADALWNAVRVVSDENGITEFYPETDEEWNTLRLEAIRIIEGANGLMMPGRRVAPPGASGEFPEFEFTPEEVQEKLDADRASWNGFAGRLQGNALDILHAIDNRDPELLTEYGAYLDEACEACHANYWYRAGI